MATLLSVNLAHPRDDRGRTVRLTGIDKRPVTGPARLDVPGDGGSGVGGDLIGDGSVHGGGDQAVYAYAREDLDAWSAELGRPLANGQFGENLTTLGLDVTGALIGEHWRIGGVLLEVTAPRIPCTTFARWMDEPRWIKRFTERAVSGAYLRVLEPGPVEAGSAIEVVHRPGHGVTTGLTFRALTTEPDLIHRLVGVDALAADIREKVARRTAGVLS
ncbi:MOSC domain-containing protein [Virgisporangium aurantiacum]|uniref:Molybdenum cofactor biosysynthesis protein n=1 Tax=Virgisporangium aurantiacum TaxID=175570 RepID=A0A8J4E207_9ACTN|nr:MOSC domain-containing protein [Virgisporangium aurantiacum]GIJ58363.1 molybdenum cofactor biosysynthesis protein [Virgisporangium aurantiacum]